MARLARRFPEIYPKLADGSLSLSVVALLKPHLDDATGHDLLQASHGLSVVRVRELLAARFPRPDVPSTIRKLPEKREACVPRAESTTLPLAAPKDLTSVAEPASVVLASAPNAAPPSAAARSSSASNTAAPSSGAPSTAAPSGAPAKQAPRASEPLAPDRYRVQRTAGSELKRKLEQCRELMRHTNPSGDFAPIVERALDLLLDKLMRERFGAAHRPRTKSSTSKLGAAVERHGGRVSARRPDRATCRAVVARDGLRCSWLGDDGERCSATGWLELDHERPFAKGGDSIAENVRVLCAAHNRLAAELAFGAQTVERAISARRARNTRHRG